MKDYADFMLCKEGEARQCHVKVYEGGEGKEMGWRAGKRKENGMQAC